MTAVVLVLLGMGSHARDNDSGRPEIYPHKPVHLAQAFDVFTEPRWNQLLIGAVDVWNDTVEDGLISFSGALGSQELDAIFIDLPEDGQQFITYNNHTPVEITFSMVFSCDPEDPGDCPNARVFTIAAHITLGRALKVVVYNQDALANPGPTDTNLKRLFTHELGHVLSLRDHDNMTNPGPYTGMMDGTGCVSACDDPGDYDILEFTEELLNDIPILRNYADEVSCVRELFEVTGRQKCESIN